MHQCSAPTPTQGYHLVFGKIALEVPVGQNLGGFHRFKRSRMQYVESSARSVTRKTKGMAE